MKAVGVITTVLVALIVTPIWRGYVLSILWGWFIVSTFGLPALAIAPAIGLSYVVSFLTFQHVAGIKDERSSTEKVIESVVYAFGVPLLALAFGAVVHSFM